MIAAQCRRAAAREMFRGAFAYLYASNFAARSGAAEPDSVSPRRVRSFFEHLPTGQPQHDARVSWGKLHASAPRQTADALTRTGSTQSIDVNFWLAVVTSGEFRYFLNIEAQP